MLSSNIFLPKTPTLFAIVNPDGDHSSKLGFLIKRTNYFFFSLRFVMNLDFGNNFDNADAISADRATLYQYVGISSAHTTTSVGTKNDTKTNVSVMYLLPFCLAFRMTLRLEYFSLVLNFNFIRNYPCLSCPSFS